MSAHRKHVFTEKVLKRLFPNVSSGQDKETLQTPALETPPKNVTPEAVEHTHGHRLADGDIKIQPERRLYTVSLPPPGYVPSLPEPTSCANSESASSGGDTEEPALHDQPKRRIRRHKSKKNVKPLNDAMIKQAEPETQTQPGLPHEKMHAGAPTMSKNKRKKLKKKLQLKRRKAAGSVAKPFGLSFMYQPESSSEADADAGDVSGGEAEDDQECAVTDTTQEDIELANSKADGVLSFLKSTQEIYFYDDTSEGFDPAVCIETSEELLHLLESRRMPPSDVLILDHMKTLLLLQDTERLQSALRMFPEHCAMPPDHARVISAFFNYWIIHILPEKQNSE